MVGDLMSRTSKRAGYGPLIGATNAKFTVGATAPSYPKKNDIWINTTDDEFNYWDGAAWVTLASGSGSPFPPGIYGTVGNPLIVELNLAFSYITARTEITAEITTELLTDIETNPTLDLALSNVIVSGINAPTITVVIT